MYVWVCTLYGADASALRRHIWCMLCADAMPIAYGRTTQPPHISIAYEMTATRYRHPLCHSNISCADDERIAPLYLPYYVIIIWPVPVHMNGDVRAPQTSCLAYVSGWYDLVVSGLVWLLVSSSGHYHMNAVYPYVNCFIALITGCTPATTSIPSRLHRSLSSCTYTQYICVSHSPDNVAHFNRFTKNADTYFWKCIFSAYYRWIFALRLTGRNRIRPKPACGHIHANVRLGVRVCVRCVVHLFRLCSVSNRLQGTILP